LERKFGDLLDRYSIKREWAEALAADVAEHVHELRDATEQRQSTLKRQVTDLELERQRIFEFHRAGTYSTEEFLEQKAVLNQQINEKKLLLVRGEVDDRKMEREITAVLAAFERPRETWYALQGRFPRRVSFQRLIFPNGVLIEGQVLRTPVPSLIYQLSEAVSGGKNHVVPLLISRWDDLASEVRQWSEFLRQGNCA
jgi:hypothetical protein